MYGALTAKPGMRKRSRMANGITSGADQIEVEMPSLNNTGPNMFARKQAGGMLSMRTASQKPGIFHTLLKDSA
jgi:hypothetical protein